MDIFVAIGDWIANRESLLSGAVALVVLLGVVASAVSFIYRRVASARAIEASDQNPIEDTRITLKSLSAPAPFPIQFAQSDGLRLAYAVMGQGPHNIMMTPGIISHLNITSHLPPFRDTMEAIGKFSRVVFFDKRGQGLSDPSVNVATLDERVQDIEAVMDAAGMGREILYGISEGGPMCLKFAHDHPNRVKGLVLLGTTARWLQSDDFPMGIEESVLDALSEAWGTGVLRNIFFPSITHEQMDDKTYRGFEHLIATRQSIRQLVEYIKKTDVQPLLTNIRCPTLVIHFAGDMAIPIRLGRALAEALPNAQFLEVAGIDHADLSQAPEAIERIREFASSL
jgi:pimeloyl-ACP methyl ester carboxylesterase